MNSIKRILNSVSWLEGEILDSIVFSLNKDHGTTTIETEIKIESLIEEVKTFILNNSNNTIEITCDIEKNVNYRFVRYSTIEKPLYFKIEIDIKKLKISYFKKLENGEYIKKN